MTKPPSKSVPLGITLITATHKRLNVLLIRE